MNLAPIALFVYNRPWHTRQTVEALRANAEAVKSQLYIFSDAPKSETQFEAVREVRQYIRQIDEFKSVTIVERETNFGLARSIIDGVTSIVNEFGRIIVLEDDIVTNPYFLKFMNEALNKYQTSVNVGSITGFALPITIPPEYPNQVYLTHRHSSWGWGTFERVWREIDWDVRDYDTFRKDLEARKAFNIAGEDMALMLDLQMNGKINSWSIRFDYSCFKRKLFSVAPVEGLVSNIGFDGTGVHCSENSANLRGQVVCSAGQFIFPQNLEFDSKVVQDTRKLFQLSVYKRIKYLAYKCLAVMHRHRMELVR